MTYLEIIIIGIGLSMDAFAVAICNGLAMKKFRVKEGLIIAGAFGFFQALMPVIGWVLGSGFAKYIEKYDHWIAFILLAFIGIKMIIDAVKDMRDKFPEKEYSLKFTDLIISAVATSIDALAVGLSFAFLNIQSSEGSSNPGILISVLIIGIITFMLSAAGVFIGTRFGKIFETAAQFIGGGILILIGIKILLEHLGVISF